ncbi:MAG: glycosyltransferase [Actinobacteria bacterium]|nr:glycosyltransferase [Actinomycetota bacterium]
MRPSILLGGALASRPGVGGHAWVLLHYLLGFRALGWRVTLVDRLDRAALPAALDPTVAHRELRGVLRRFDLVNDYVCLTDEGTTGPAAAGLDSTLSGSLLIDVMGFIGDHPLRDRASYRVFLDIDPGFPQLWRELGHADVLDGYDAYVTVGTAIGRLDCEIPRCGLDWIPTLPPVVLDHWPESPSPARTFTSVAAWRGPFGPIDQGGRRLGLRVHEFRRFLALPTRTHADFELALDIHPDETIDLERLAAQGWRLVDPAKVAATPDDYQTFVRSSGAEFMVAKNLYVDTRGGWFSDRSACYLASGKPVLFQDTGLAGSLPDGLGLLLYADLDSAVAGVHEILANYEGHARAARALAIEHLDARRVLTTLLDRLGIT